MVFVFECVVMINLLLTSYASKCAASALSFVVSMVRGRAGA